MYVCISVRAYIRVHIFAACGSDCFKDGGVGDRLSLLVRIQTFGICEMCCNCCCNCCCFCVSRLTMNCLWCPYFATRHTGKYTKLTKLLSRWRHRKKLRQTTITTHYWLSLSRVKCVKIRRKIGILVLMLLSVQTETLLALFVCIGEFESEVKENAQIRAKS